MSAEEAKETGEQRGARLRGLIDEVHKLLRARGITQASDALAIAGGVILDVFRAATTVRYKRMVLSFAAGIISTLVEEMKEAEERRQ